MCGSFVFIFILSVCREISLYLLISSLKFKYLFFVNGVFMIPSSSLMLLIKVRLGFLLLVWATWLLQRVAANATMEFLLVVCLLLALDKRRYLGNHIRGRTPIRRCQLPTSSRGSLSTTLRNKALSVQIRTHDGHTWVLTHLRWIALQLASQAHTWRTAFDNTTGHSQVRADTFVAHYVLLRNVTKLSMMTAWKTCMSSKLLLKGSLAASETTTLLALSGGQLGRVRCVACTSVIKALIVPLEAWLLRIRIWQLSSLLLLRSASAAFVRWLWPTIMMLCGSIDFVYILACVGAIADPCR